MEDTRAIPLVYSKDSEAPVDEDLSMALVFWSLESRREKGGGFLKKKNAEDITQVSLIQRPILITEYGKATVAFDGCGIHSTQIKFGVAPSLTYPLSYLISDNWTSKPESYAEGLGSHSQEFEKARQENSREIRGWITQPDLLNDLTVLLNVATVSKSRTDVLPQLIDFHEASDSLAELDKLKNILHNEIVSLKVIKQNVSEKTSEVLTPLKKECSQIEDRYNKEIEKIRPSVVERKEKYENKRMEQVRQIEARFSGRLHDLQNKRDAASAKIDAYDPYGGREPRGGIDKQYSIKRTAEHRIKDLESEKDGLIADIDERYQTLIDEEQGRIDSLEKQKQDNLKEPRRKIQHVNQATDRLVKVIDGLIESHDSVIHVGLASNIVRPTQIEASEFTVYLPTIISEFDNGEESRTEFITASSLKDGKGFFGGLKSLVGRKFMPLEQPSESLTEFVTSITEDSKMAEVISTIAKRTDVLRNPQIRNMVTSGIGKMRVHGWIKEKESVEFQKALDEHFGSANPQGPSTEGEHEKATQLDETKQELQQLVRFVNHNGVESQVEIDKLEALRKEDSDQFEKESPLNTRTTNDSARLLEFLVGLRIPHTKEYCIEHSEDWVQNQLYAILVNNHAFRAVARERTFNVGNLEARIDFDVNGIGIEVKIFRSMQDFDRLTREMLVYGKEYNEILIPYINAGGGLSNEQLETALNLLSEHYPQVKGYFQLNCSETF